MGHELIQEVGASLNPINRQDLKFSVATAHSLICDDIELALSLYDEALKEEGTQEMRGVILNNLGMTNFFNFIALSQGEEDPAQIPAEKLQKILKAANEAIKQLKLSVLTFEDFNERLKHLEEGDGTQ